VCVCVHARVCASVCTLMPSASSFPSLPSSGERVCVVRVCVCECVCVRERERERENLAGAVGVQVCVYGCVCEYMFAHTAPSPQRAAASNRAANEGRGCTARARIYK
jgi:hypothetical protein